MRHPERFPFLLFSQALHDGEISQALLPIENSTGGSVHDVYLLLPKYGLHVVGEYSLGVEHCLLTYPGTDINSIKRVFSHWQVGILGNIEHFQYIIRLLSDPHSQTAGSALPVLLSCSNSLLEATVGCCKELARLGVAATWRHVFHSHRAALHQVDMPQTDQEELEAARPGDLSLFILRTNHILNWVQKGSRNQREQRLRLQLCCAVPKSPYGNQSLLRNRFLFRLLLCFIESGACAMYYVL